MQGSLYLDEANQAMTTEIKAEIAGLNFDLDGNQTLLLRIHGNGKALYEAFKDKTLSVQIKEYKHKRSKNANSFCWALCTEIADILRSDKDSVYLEMLKRYGQSELISVLSEVNMAGYLKYFEIAGESRLNGKDFTHYKVFKGSSEYNTREMSIFLDGIVSEAEMLGIPVLSDSELALLKEEWK